MRRSRDGPDAVYTHTCVLATHTTPHPTRRWHLITLFFTRCVRSIIITAHETRGPLQAAGGHPAAPGSAAEVSGRAAPKHPAPPQGVFVLSDNNFRWLSRLPPAPPAGSDPPTPEAASQRAAAAAAASNQLHLACGLLAGALSQLGVACVVEADARACPAVAFTVRIATTA
jgi:hypothetical protein